MAEAAEATSAFNSRSIDKRVLSREQGEGVGARVRRSIGRPELRNFDPFLMLDEFKVGKPAGTICIATLQRHSIWASLTTTDFFHFFWFHCRRVDMLGRQVFRTIRTEDSRQ